MNTAYISLSSQGGWSTGYTFGASIFSGLPISTNFLTAGVNYNMTNNSWSGNLSAWQVDQNGWAFNPSVSAAIYPEHTTNFVRGQGFRSNDKVLSRFVAANNHQGAIDYWGLKGTYNPEAKNPYTDPVTGSIYYNNYAFEGGFDRLYSIADHEMFHRKNVLSGKYKNVTIDSEVKGKEEWAAYMHNYKNEGLYSDSDIPVVERIKTYGRDAGYYDMIKTPRGSFYNTFQPRWWHIIYKIPRLY